MGFVASLFQPAQPPQPIVRRALYHLGLIAMAAFYGAAGALHLAWPEPFIRIIPAFLPNPGLLVLLSGLAELTLAAALLPLRSRRLAAFGLILYCLAVFPANVNMALTDGLGMGWPTWALWARLPFQGLLVWWAWAYVRR